MRLPHIGVLAAAALVLFTLAGCTPADREDLADAFFEAAADELFEGDPLPSPVSGEPVDTSAALTTLEDIPVKGRAPRTGYEREEKFGRAWLDVDGNGCRTRDDVLARDLLDPVLDDDGCKVLSGTLEDPYTGEVIAFERGEDTSALVQIDHVVALSNAWQTGAQQLSQGEREALANDPMNLIATDGPTNGAKGDGDAATWLPPHTPFRCAYVSAQIDVKAAYDLWVTQAEKDAMERVLSRC